MKRPARFSVTPRTYRGRHAMHKYWSKKPHESVAQFICHYSKKNQIVLDPFCGSGVAISEAIRLDRRAIGIDINPIAIRQTLAGINHIDLEKLADAFKQIKQEVQPVIRPYYQITCPSCHLSDALITHTIWQKSTPIESWVFCDQCKQKNVIKNPEISRLNPVLPHDARINRIIFANSRLSLKKDCQLLDFFTQKNAYSLLVLLNAVARIDDTMIRETLEFCFTGAVAQASKLVFVIRNRQGKAGRPQVGSWISGFWLPDEFFEIYPWQCFENRYKKILAGKKEIHQEIPSVTRHLTQDSLLAQQTGYLVKCHNAANLSFIKDESVDYVITDPPHGNRIPYLELSQLWNGWLSLLPDWENELVISDAKSRQKNLLDYQKRLDIALSEASRVLKTEHFISVMFNARDFCTWEALLTAFSRANLWLFSADKLTYSAASIAQETRQKALPYDLVITCQKTIPNPEQIAEKQKIIEWISLILAKEKRPTHEVLRQCLQFAQQDKLFVCPFDFLQLLTKTAHCQQYYWSLS